MAIRKLKWKLKERIIYVLRLLFKCLSRLCENFFFKKWFTYYTHLDIQQIVFELCTVCSHFGFLNFHNNSDTKIFILIFFSSGKKGVRVRQKLWNVCTSSAKKKLQLYQIDACKLISSMPTVSTTHGIFMAK